MGVPAQTTKSAAAGPEQTPKSSPQEPLHDRLTLKEMADKVRPISKEEWRARFVEGKDPARSQWLTDLYPDDATFMIDGRIFGIARAFCCLSEYESIFGHFSEVKLPDETARALVYQLNTAITRLSRIIDISAYNKDNNFPIRIKEGVFMDIMIKGPQVRIGPQVARMLLEAEGRSVQHAIQIQAMYFHEQIHLIRLEICNGDRSERLSLFGEFLYDPAADEYRNQYFRKMGEVISELYCLGIEKCLGIATHEREWLIVSRLLIWEYARIDAGFSVPQTLEKQLAVVVGLPELYKNVPQETRDAILKKYITMPCEEIERLSAEYGKELGLAY